MFYFAVTIHKAQGQSLAFADIKLEQWFSSPWKKSNPLRFEIPSLRITDLESPIFFHMDSFMLHVHVLNILGIFCAPEGKANKSVYLKNAADEELG